MRSALPPDRFLDAARVFEKLLEATFGTIFRKEQIEATENATPLAA